MYWADCNALYVVTDHFIYIFEIFDNNFQKSHEVLPVRPILCEIEHPKLLPGSTGPHLVLLELVGCGS